MGCCEFALAVKSRSPDASRLTSRGSKQNFRSLAKTFAQKLGMPVYTLVRLS